MRLLKIFLIMGLLCSCSGYESEREILEKIEKIAFGVPKNLSVSEKHGDLLVAIPKIKKSEYLVIFIFGGLHYANPDFMIKNTLSKFFEKNIVVVAPCKNAGGKGFKAYKKQLDKYLLKKGLNARDFKVCGFSGGGPDALEAEGASIRLIGLIDAVPEIPKKRKHFPILINAFNRKNWIGNPVYNSEDFSNFVKWIEKESATVEENSVNHQLFPKYFFYRYRRHFNR